MLDYVVNDQAALAVLGVDQQALRERMTGLRGRSLPERRALYRQDLRAMLRGVFRVLRPGGRAAFVVGNGTVSGSEDRTTAELPGWADDAGLTFDLRLRKCVFGLYNVMKDEDIVIFRNPATSPAGASGVARCATRSS